MSVAQKQHPSDLAHGGQRTARFYRPAGEGPVKGYKTAHLPYLCNARFFRKSLISLIIIFIKQYIYNFVTFFPTSERSRDFLPPSPTSPPRPPRQLFPPLLTTSKNHHKVIYT